MLLVTCLMKYELLARICILVCGKLLVYDVNSLSQKSKVDLLGLLGFTVSIL